MATQHILVVDDEPSNALLLEKMLRHMDFTVDVVTSGEAAIRRTADTQPVLVLMDIVLPGVIDGIEAAREIWRSHNIPVVYVTAHTEDELLRRASATSPFGYLVKPFTERDLSATVRMALYTAEAERKLRRSEERSRSLEAQMQQAQRMESIALLTSGIAHDFNNALMAVIGYGEFALRALPNDSPARSDVTQALLASERARELVHQLLAFSRRRTIARQLVDVNDVIADVEQIVRHVVDTMTVHTILDPSLGMIEAAPSQVDQILMNLVVNARDAMPDGGTLTIETSNVDIDDAFSERHPVVRPGSYVRISVRDTGTGMDTDTQSHIFEPFFTTKPIGRGTGLGLSTVSGILRQWCGAIEVSSQVGRGTTFNLYIPRLITPAKIPADNQQCLATVSP